MVCDMDKMVTIFHDKGYPLDLITSVRDEIVLHRIDRFSPIVGKGLERTDVAS